MPNVTINLPSTFHTHPRCQQIFDRLNEADGMRVRRTSHNSGTEILPDLQWSDAVLMWSWPALTDELLDQAPNLKFSAQLDISQSAAKTALRRGLPVTIARSAFSSAVSEMALALILSTLRRTSDYHRQMREGTEPWIQAFPGDIDPRERQLTGRTVGIVGFGQIGRRLAELLAPFQCRLLVADPFVTPAHLGQFSATSLTAEDLAKESEIIVLCAATNSHSRQVFGAQEIASLRPGAVIVNVGRSALMDYNALLERLRAGDIDAALDVFDNEPLELESEFRKLPNAFLTPHRAGGIWESVDRILQFSVDDLIGFFQGKPQKYPLQEWMIPMLDS